VNQLKDWTYQILIAIQMIPSLWSESMDWFSNSSIVMDRDATRLRMLLPSIIDESPPSSSTRSANNNLMSIIGAVFVKIVKCGKPWNTFERFSEMEQRMKWMRRELPSLDDVGLDFCCRLFHSTPQDPYTVEDALGHPFLQPRRVVGSIPQYRASEAVVNPTRTHVLPSIWVTLADWAMEICMVFELDMQVAFRAMSFFEKVVSRTDAAVRVACPVHQLLLGACAMTATKLSRHNRSLTAQDIAYCTDNVYPLVLIGRAEEFVLHQVEWQLGHRTILDCARSLYPERLPRDMVDYISYWALLSQLYLTYPPSVSGAAVSAVAQYCMGQHPEVSNELQEPVSHLLRGIHHLRATNPDLMIERLSRQINLPRPIPRTLDLQMLRG